MKRTEKNVQEAAKLAAKSEILLTEEPGYLIPEGVEHTSNISQSKLVEEVDIQTSTKMFNLQLTQFGPYTFDYTKNGRYLLLGGRKGHLALLDWQKKKLFHEFNVKETIKDVK